MGYESSLKYKSPRRYQHCIKFHLWLRLQIKCFRKKTWSLIELYCLNELAPGKFERRQNAAVRINDISSQADIFRMINIKIVQCKQKCIGIRGARGRTG